RRRHDRRPFAARRGVAARLVLVHRRPAAGRAERERGDEQRLHLAAVPASYTQYADALTVRVATMKYDVFSCFVSTPVSLPRGHCCISCGVRSSRKSLSKW